jgi:hypothetical protein
MHKLRHVRSTEFEDTQMTEQTILQPTAHKAYKLTQEFSRYDGYHEVELADYDAWLIHFPGRENYPEYSSLADYFWEPQVLNFPERIEFECMGDFLEVSNPTARAQKKATDYPHNREGWPIMSKRMLNALLSVRDFPHQAIPIVMIDGIEGDSKTFDESHDFVAVQLLEHQDIFDWENSAYELDPECSDIIDRLDKLVLKIPQHGLPPLFRISTTPLQTRLFVSAEGRAALEQAGVKGVSFVESEYVRC